MTSLIAEERVINTFTLLSLMGQRDDTVIKHLGRGDDLNWGVTMFKQCLEHPL
jgi:hypothetical protein